MFSEKAFFSILALATTLETMTARTLLDSHPCNITVKIATVSNYYELLR